jgi:hypothetical protein
MAKNGATALTHFLNLLAQGNERRVSLPFDQLQFKYCIKNTWGLAERSMWIIFSQMRYPLLVT